MKCLTEKQYFKSFTKDGEGYALYKNQNINIFYVFKGLVNTETTTTSRNATQNFILKS